LMHRDGSLQVYSANALGLHRFATEVFARRSEIRQANKVGRRTKPAFRSEQGIAINPGDPDQFDLFDEESPGCD